MGDNVASTTLLISAFGTAILVCIIYFLHAHLLPHLRRSKARTKGRADTPLPYGGLPQWQVRSDPQLREILYHAPTPNYVDPRNSVAGSDLKRSRWSTNIEDLSHPSPMSFTSRSAKKHVRQFSLLDVPLTPDRRLPAPSLHSHTTQRNQKATRRKTLDQEYTRRKNPRPMSMIAVVAADTEPLKTRRPARPRSRSDSQVITRKSVLARSHASFYGGDFIAGSQSHISSVLSETSSQSPLTQSHELRDSSRTSSSYFPDQLQAHNDIHRLNEVIMSSALQGTSGGG